MKSLLKAFTLASLIVAVAGCDSASGGGTLDPIDPSTVSVYVHVEPSVDNGSATSAVSFKGWVQINSDEDLSTATVKINGTTLPKNNYIDNYFGSTGVGSLKQGDAVSVTISHPRLPEINVNSTVPESITDFTTTPAFPAKGVANTTRTYAVDWTTVSGAAEYYLSENHYASSGGNLTSGYGMSYSSHPVNLSFPFSDSESVYPWIGIEVNTLNLVDFADTYGLEHAELNVCGTRNVVKTN